MNTLKGSTRKYLRELAHHLNPVVMVGKNGLTDNLIRKVDEALDSHELIKVKFIDLKDKKKELSKEIAQRTRCENVGMVGHVAIFFREHPDEEKRKIKLPPI